MGKIVDHAKRELETAGYYSPSEDSYNHSLAEDTLAVLSLLESQFHSGFSIKILLDLVNTLSDFGILTPLSGICNEWMEPYEDGSKMNRRCPRVFKDPDGNAFDCEGILFRSPDGVTYWTKDSWVPVKFPYLPKTKIVDIEGEPPNEIVTTDAPIS